MKYETINNQLCRMVEQPCPHCGQPEIIATPVADGSAEWALWQMEQGKKVCHKSYTMKTTHCAINDESQVVIFTTPYSVTNGGDVVCHADEWLDHRQYGRGVDERTGWQLYEPQPEPKPTFKVGDWVTDGIIPGYIKRWGWGMDMAWVKTQDAEYHINLCNLRKLDPSEVRVKVVLEGTVSQDSILDKASCFSLHTDRSEHIISLSEIEDSELVESLLKAQLEAERGRQ